MTDYIAFSTIHVPPRFVLRDLRPADKYAAPLIAYPVAPDALTINLVSGGAFGSGAHPTTQLCLSALSEIVTPQTSMLDLGCGSGVLAIGGAKLGAQKVVAVDIDQTAVIRTRDNAILNNISGRIDVRLGSTEVAMPDAPFDVLAANLLTPVILKLAPQMIELIGKNGKLILSGVLSTQLDRIRHNLDTLGIRIIETRAMSGWCVLISERIA